jgi:hypothetical protein
VPRLPRVAAALALALVTALSLLVAVGAGIATLGCCAIDCEKYPAKCAENRERQRDAGLVLLAALAVAAGSGVAAMRVARGGRRPG